MDIHNLFRVAGKLNIGRSDGVILGAWLAGAGLSNPSGLTATAALPMKFGYPAPHLDISGFLAPVEKTPSGVMGRLWDRVDRPADFGSRRDKMP